MRRPGIVRRALTTAAVATLALGVAGCGNNTAADTSGKPAAGSAASKNPEGLTRDDFVQAVYDASVKAGSAHTTMKMSGAAQMTAEGDVSYGGGTPAMQMTMAMGGGSATRMTMRLTDGIFYLQIPGVTPRGKFVSVNPKDKNSPMGQQYADLSGQLDPLTSITSLKTALRKVELVGKEDIDGEETDHYELTVDSAALTKQMKVPAQAQSQLPKTLTYDMWIDEDNLLRQTTFDLSGSAFEMKMSKWGEPVTIEKPATRDVVKMSGP